MPGMTPQARKRLSRESHARMRRWVALTSEELIAASREDYRLGRRVPLVLTLVMREDPPSGPRAVHLDYYANFDPSAQSELACGLLSTFLGHFSGAAPQELVEQVAQPIDLPEGWEAGDEA